MWVLIGCKIEHEYGYGGYTGRTETVEEKLALFSSKGLAEAYVEKSKLKNPTWKRKYRSNSLLARYEWAEIDEYMPESFPVDPEL